MKKEDVKLDWRAIARQTAEEDLIEAILHAREPETFNWFVGKFPDLFIGLDEYPEPVPVSALLDRTLCDKRGASGPA
ncbi:MAG: hypothetical protein COU68_01775 [Candidatus Pacebacteria bacterium CG10_big_fil_rev_8_21_14_0_10_45_6]|nr:MAG: hypothetical protein COU68_01775 [Candidatus Pacebacteria bacterium CG10_big_fil_rev_8_21_14_0_10_45_6]